MAAFIVSSFGAFVMSLFADLFTTPSWQTFTLLAYGWAVAGGERQTITTYLWLTGATSVKHFSCYYPFLGGALYQARWHLWARIIRCAARWVPEGAPIMLIVDDSTKKKAGHHIEGVGYYRNGAGSARQEYRTLRGLNFVWGQMRIPVPGWPSRSVSVPIGLSLYLKAEQAHKLHVPYQSRSALAREIVDFVAAQLPTRRIRVLGDGGYATKDTLQQSEYRPNAGGLLSEAPSKGALEPTFLIGLFLFPDVLLHTLQLKAHGGHCIPTGPEVLADEIAIFLLHAPSKGKCALPFQKATPRGDRMFGRNLQTHMDMIRQQVSFNDPTLFLPR
jgi:hypothetical protein